MYVTGRCPVQPRKSVSGEIQQVAGAESRDIFSAPPFNTSTGSAVTDR
nr:hypothetical protein [Escherichia coli]